MFAPAIPLTGYAGWRVFEGSESRQFQTFADQKTVQRELGYFREKIGTIESAAALVADRRLLAVALGAFGLEEEIDKRAIIRRTLEENTFDPKSFANRLNDPRWKAFAEAFGFGDFIGPRVRSPENRRRVEDQYLERSFERAVGNVDTSFRLAMNFRREAKAIASGANADRVGWFQILGQRPLREVLEKAFGLPPTIAGLDIDRQHKILAEESERLTGSRSPAAFLDDANIDLILRRYFARLSSEFGAGASTRGYGALSSLENNTSTSAALSLLSPQ